jgi:hypothetical protein
MGMGEYGQLSGNMSIVHFASMAGGTDRQDGWRDWIRHLVMEHTNGD